MHRLPTVTRRTALRRILVGAAALPFLDVWGFRGLGGVAAAQDVTTPGPGKAGRAKAVIEVWLSGGPCHVDTFDPKPEAGADWSGPLDAPIETNVSGVRIGQLLPLLAKQADKYSLIRTLSHGSFGHETATYIAQTGRDAGGRLVHPCVGAVVSELRGRDHGYEGLIPPYVILTRSLGRFSETGFLGPRYGPFVTGGDPNQRRFLVEGVTTDGVSEDRQTSRRELLRDLDTLGDALGDDPGLASFDRSRDSAYELILGDAGKIFDLSQEKDATRDAYGRSTFGQSCLMARRLVENGVPYVTINFGGWDTHKQHFETMRRKLPDLDRGLAALLQDLSDRGLLSSTIVWCTGEFGRTPKVQWEPPWNGGRGHHGRCWSALVAGGGFRGGQVVGTSDAKGDAPADRPVHPRELHGAIYSLLGIDPDGPLPNPRGLDISVTEPSPAELGKKRLPELV